MTITVMAQTLYFPLHTNYKLLMRYVMKINQLVAVFSILITSFFTQAQLENVLVEKYYISDDFDALDTNGGKLLSGSTTYRIYIDLAQGSKLISVYADKNHPFSIKSTKPFFNHKIEGQSFGKDFTSNRLSKEGTLALDSWLTLGQIGKSNVDKTYYGLPKEEDKDSSIIGGKLNDGGSSKFSFPLFCFA